MGCFVGEKRLGEAWIRRGEGAGVLVVDGSTCASSIIKRTEGRALACLEPIQSVTKSARHSLIGWTSMYVDANNGRERREERRERSIAV